MANTRKHKQAQIKIPLPIQETVRQDDIYIVAGIQGRVLSLVPDGFFGISSPYRYHFSHFSYSNLQRAVFLRQTPEGKLEVTAASEDIAKRLEHAEDYINKKIESDTTKKPWEKYY